MIEAAYDPVAALYDRAFADIRVRAPELRWLTSRLAAQPSPPRVLDIGCGNGALLRAIAAYIARGEGVDVSAAMIERARARTHEPRLAFRKIDGAQLPFADGSFDVVISFLSFRYLDWERSYAEIARVLAPGGRFLMLDLVRRRARVHVLPLVARCGVRNLWQRARNPEFVRALSELTRHPDWARMLARHPMRSAAAYERFFRARLLHPRFELIDVAASRRIVALDTGPLHV